MDAALGADLEIVARTVIVIVGQQRAVVIEIDIALDREVGSERQAEATGAATGAELVLVRVDMLGIGDEGVAGPALDNAGDDEGERRGLGHIGGPGRCRRQDQHRNCR